MSWVIHFGPIPLGKMILHSCDKPDCVNPYHLYLGTGVENMLDMVKKGRAASGERNRNAKLTNKQRLDLYKLWKSGIKLDDLAKKFGLKKSGAYCVVESFRKKDPSAIKRQHKKITDSILQEVIKKRSEGLSLNKLGVLFNVCGQTILNNLKKESSNA